MMQFGVLQRLNYWLMPHMFVRRDVDARFNTENGVSLHKEIATKLLRIENVAVASKKVLKGKDPQPRKMSQFTQRDLRCLLKFCQSLLVPCGLEAFPQQVLSRLVEVIPGEIWFYVKVNFQTRSVSTLASSLDAASSLTARAIKETAQHHFHFFIL